MMSEARYCPKCGPMVSGEAFKANPDYRDGRWQCGECGCWWHGPYLAAPPKQPAGFIRAVLEGRG